MVKAVDIEGLFKKYLDENSLEKADALYLLATIDRMETAYVLTTRYGISGPLNSVLEDLKNLGAEGTFYSIKMEDTGEDLRETIIRAFESLCLHKILEVAISKAESLTQTARKLLYIISVAREHEIDLTNIEDIRKVYVIMFGERISKHEIEKTLRELVRCYLIQSVNSTHVDFPRYIDDLLVKLKELMPKVEVRVSWQKNLR